MKLLVSYNSSIDASEQVNMAEERPDTSGIYIDIKHYNYNSLIDYTIIKNTYNKYINIYIFLCE